MSVEYCPICDYNLTGLPPNHGCPECGRGYDQDTWVFEGPKRRSQFTFTAVLSAAVALSIMLTLLGSKMGRWTDYAGMFIFSFNAWIFWRNRNRPDDRLIISRDGCVVENARGSREWRWGEIAGVERRTGWFYFLVTLTDHDGRRHVFTRTSDRAKADSILEKLQKRITPGPS